MGSDRDMKGMSESHGQGQWPCTSSLNQQTLSLHCHQAASVPASLG